jgi:hypothetical protein
MTEPGTQTTKTFDYRFERENGESIGFRLELRLPALELVPASDSTPPNWSRLEERQCSHCPLQPTTHSHCPVAVNLAPVVEVFKHCISHEPARVTITTEARAYRKTVDLQSGISSLMGLIMVTSGCPVMDRLRPMVCTHQPFATVEETFFRAVSSYLMAQYIRQQQGKEPDWTLTRFASMYNDVSQLNACFKERLQLAVVQDANLNALTQLDCFGTFSTLSLEDGGLDDLLPVFRAHLEQTS